MRKNANEVINAFKARKALSPRGRKTIWTDGRSLWSYNMEIARWIQSGTTKEGLPVMVLARSGLPSPSVTTTSHMNALHDVFVPYSWVRLAACGHDDCSLHPELGEACAEGRKQ